MEGGSATTLIASLQSQVQTAAGDLGDFVSAVAPSLLAVTIGLVALGLAIRLIRRAG